MRFEAALDHHHRGRGDEHGDRGERAQRQILGRGDAVGQAPAALGGLAPAPVGASLADPDLVADPLQLRRALAQAGAAVRALGHVRAHLGAAALADDGELGAGHPLKYGRRQLGLGDPCDLLGERVQILAVCVGDRELAVSAGAVGEQVLDRPPARPGNRAPRHARRAARRARGPSPEPGPACRRGSRSAARRCRGARRGSCCRRSARRGTRPAARRRRRARRAGGRAQTTSAASETVCSTRVCWSKTRVSTVPRFG